MCGLRGACVFETGGEGGGVGFEEFGFNNVYRLDNEKGNNLALQVGCLEGGEHLCSQREGGGVPPGVWLQ